MGDDIYTTETSGELEASFERLQVAVSNRLEKIIDLLKKTQLDDDQSGVAHINDLLLSLDVMVDSVPISRVGFFGRRGAGKTTLLNRILGDDLLPTGDGRAITASLTEVIGWPQKRFVSVITFITQQEWEESVNLAKQDWEEIYTTRINDSNADDETSPAIDNLHQKLKALWGDSFEAEFSSSSKHHFLDDSRTPLELLPETFQLLLSKKYEIISCEDTSSMKEKLSPYMKRREKYWPLISRIVLYGPFKTLCNGSFSILDIPGEGDNYDFSLNDRFDEGRSLCDRLFFVPEKALLISPATAKVCVSLENHLISQFALVIPRLDEHLTNFSEDNWSNDNVEEKIRSELCKQLRMPNEKQLMQTIPMYCVENGQKKSEYTERFDKFLDTALFKKSYADIKDCIDRYLTHVNTIFELLTASIKMTHSQAESIRAEVSTLQNLSSSNCLQENIINNWFANLEKMPGEDLFDSSHHYTYFQRLLRTDQRILTDILFARAININGLKKLRELVENAIANLQGNFMQPYAKFTMKYSDVHTAISKISSRVPDMNGFERKCLRDAEQVLVKSYGETWCNMYASGTGCKNRMITNLNNWEKRNRDRIHTLLKETITSSCDSWVDKKMESFKKEFEKTWNQFLKYPEICGLIDKANLLELLSPVTRKDASFLSRTEVVQTEVVEDNTQSVPALTSLQRLIEFIKQHEAILSPVETHPMRLRSKPGYVYVLKNPAYKDGIYKIGMTERNVQQRMKELQGSTGVPLPFEQIHYWPSDTPKSFEKTMHGIFRKVRVNRRREFFQAPSDVIQNVGDLVDSVIREQECVSTN